MKIIVTIDPRDEVDFIENLQLNDVIHEELADFTGKKRFLLEFKHNAHYIDFMSIGKRIDSCLFLQS